MAPITIQFLVGFVTRDNRYQLLT